MMKYRLIYSMLMILASYYALGQSVSSLLEKAYDNNPELKSLELQYEAALQKAPQVSQLSDPTVGFTLPVLRPETRLGGQVFSLSASQMFPWMGTLKAKEAVVLSQAKTKLEDIERLKLEIDFEIKTAYEEVYHIFAKKRILASTLRIYEALEKVALAKVEAGQGIASDVLKIKLQVEEVKNLMRLLDNSRSSYISRINAAMNEVQDNRIDIDTSTRTFAPMLLDINEIRPRVKAGHPLFQKIDQEIVTTEKELALNELSNKPTFSLGLDYSWVAARSDANPTNNGRDILMPRIMLSLPINKGKYSAKRKEEQLKKEAYEMRKESLANTMVSEILALEAEYENAKLLYELSKKQIGLTSSAYEILLTHYSSQGQKFDELMRILEEMNRYKLSSLNAIVQSHLTKFKVERLKAF